MNLFPTVNRCPQCGGDAAARFHQTSLDCSRMLEAHLHNRCEDCGFSWCERVGQRTPPGPPETLGPELISA